MERFTKIICTIGQVSKDQKTLSQLISSGLSIVRINMSHDNHQSHQTTINNIRELEKSRNIKIPIGLDTKGPELRISNLTNEFTVNQGDKIYLSNESTDQKNCFVIPFKNLFSLKMNNEVFVDDGSLKLKVINRENNFLVTEALNNHVVTPRKKINVPGINLGIDFLSSSDKKDILFGLENKVDYIFVSFVSTPFDLIVLKDFIKNNSNYTPLIIAKLESVEGMMNLDAIIDLSDGVMIARGDLAVEIGHAETFYAQKLITEKTKEKGKILIIATQMLESMCNNPIPTRAEVSDIGNAVLDGADCVMLSAETASGKYPVQALQTMNSVINVAEQLLADKKIKYFLENCTYDCLVLYCKCVNELNFLFRMKILKPVFVKCEDESLKRQLIIRKNVILVDDEKEAMRVIGYKCGVRLVNRRESFVCEVFFTE